MKTNKFAAALLCAAVCAGAVSCNGGNTSSSRKATYVTAQENETTEATKKSDYVAVSVDGLDVLYTGWIKMPTGKEYISILNAPNDKYQNGFAYPDFPAEVYKEEGDWLLIKSNDKVGYIPKTNFTTEAPAVEGHVDNN